MRHIQFMARQYNAKVYSRYLRAEAGFTRNGSNVTALHVHGSIWMEAPDEATADRVRAFIAKLEASDEAAEQRVRDEAAREEYKLNAAAYRKIYGDQRMPYGWTRKFGPRNYNPNK